MHDAAKVSAIKYNEINIIIPISYDLISNMHFPSPIRWSTHFQIITSMKRRELWKMWEDGLCCSSSAILTQLGPSSLLKERSKTPIVFDVSLCCRLHPKLGETDKVYNIILQKDVKKVPEVHILREVHVSMHPHTHKKAVLFNRILFLLDINLIPSNSPSVLGKDYLDHSLKRSLETRKVKKVQN